MDFPTSIVALSQQTLALQGRIGATRAYVTPAAPAIAAGADSPPLPVRFTEKGYVLALYGQEAQQATLAAYAQTGLRLQINGTEDFFIDGNGGPTFASLLGLVGGQTNWYPIMRRVTQGDLWIVTFRNGSAAPITPQAQFAFMADADLDRMAKQNQGR